MVGLGLFFASVVDPRAGNARHELLEMLFIAFAAVLCGAETCVDMAAFGASKAALLRTILSLKHGTPSHDTFSRVLRLLDPAAFEAAFRAFMARFAAILSGQVGTAGQIIALDGKSLRGAVDGAKRTQPLHLVTAWAAEQCLVLGLKRAPKRSKVTAAREIIALLDLTAATVTADALHGSRATAAAIRARKGDYALAIKANRGPLRRDMQALMANPDPARAALTLEASHGRHEQRRAWVTAVPQDWGQRHTFDGLAAVARINAVRRAGGKQSTQVRHYALSRVLDPAEALRVVCAHWSIENNQHWLLDVALAEDRALTRTNNTAKNIAILRRLALNLLQADPAKTSMRLKVKKAGWQNGYLLTLLSQMR